MVVGIAAIILFQVVDTYFVGRLGANELAAMSFSFPVAYVLFSVSMGVGIGTTSVIARAIGEGDRTRVVRLTTHALMLSALVVVTLSALGLVVSPYLFRAMGANETLMPLIMEYMTPWFFGVPFLVIPMTGNSAIRATGDTKTPSIVMLVAGLANVALDPLLIFGWGPVPGLGLEGAAYATVISWTITFAAAAWMLIKRERMLSLSDARGAKLWDSWKQILYVGLPAAGTNVLIPLSTGVLTRIVAGHGALAVAGFGVGQRMEAMALIVVNAMSTALTPFVGQNIGSGNVQRVREAVRFSTRLSLAWGAFVAVSFWLGAHAMAATFNDDPTVVSATMDYLRHVPLSYGALGIAMMMNTTFIAMNKPLAASIIIAIRMFVLAVPLAYVGSLLWGLDGVFVGVAAGNLVIGALASAMMARHLARGPAAAAPATG
jgi:putative MATE family efflux protein